MVWFEVLLAVPMHFALCSAQAPPEPDNDTLPGTHFLGHDTPIANYSGKSFLKQNVPYIEIPDAAIEDVYYYRFTALMRHLAYAVQGTGYAITEFLPNGVGYAGPFSTINAAAGHHLEEARWLRSPWYLEDYTQIWTRGPGNSNQYTQWIQHSAVGARNVTGDLSFIISQLYGMIRMWEEWNHVFDSEVGLYYYTPHYDAQEFSLPGYVADAALGGNGTADITYTGPNTFRPSIYSYMIAKTEAIVHVAKSANRVDIANMYEQKVDSLRKFMQNHLWNDTQAFYVDNIKAGEPGAGQVHGREAIGFFPFRFGIGLSEDYTTSAIGALVDPEVFGTLYTPPTLERGNQYYDPNVTGGCHGNGQSWPYSTSHVIQSLAAVHRQGGLTAAQYVQSLHNYAITKCKDGVPYVAESHYPEKDGWSQDVEDHSEHYMHSTYINNVVTGLLGLIPRADNMLEISPIIPDDWTYFALENVAYHGKLITIIYDKDGTRYNQGSGLVVFANGELIHTSDDLKAMVQLSSNDAPTDPSPMDVNIAANPIGPGGWPRITATYTWEEDNEYLAIDGALYYDEKPHNRWSNYKSSSSNDTLTIELQRPRKVAGVVLAIFEVEGGLVACPARVTIADESGRSLADLTGFASTCLPNDLNVISFNGDVEIQKFQVNLFSQEGKYVGINELQIWVPANTGPFYYAADALPKGGNVTFDPASPATSNGAVVSLNTIEFSLAFSGVFSREGGNAAAQLRYKNNGASEVTLKITVNRILNSTVILSSTGEGYGVVDMPLELRRGTNFVTLYGGGEDVFIEGIDFSLRSVRFSAPRSGGEA